MLETLITLLLPDHANEREVAFHRNLVLRVYTDYYETLLATGYRDREHLAETKERTAYSMSVLRRHDRGLWRRIRRFHRRAWGLTLKPIGHPEEIPGLVPLP